MLGHRERAGSGRFDRWSEYRLDQADLERLRYALALTMGSQVVSALLDTCGLDIDQARDVTRFAAQTIVADTLRSASLLRTSSRSDT